LGHVRDTHIRLDRERGHRAVVPVRPRVVPDSVALISAVVSTDGDLLRAAADRGAAGIVVAATGSGNTDPDLLQAAVEAMASGIPVALTTRCASGGVGPLYGFPGGGRSWLEAGAILAGTLSGPKARIALSLGIGAGLERRALGRLLGEADG
jgi:L-asparaginase